MKKTIKFISASLLSLTMAFGVGFTLIKNAVTNIQEAQAATHTANYDNYTYSGSYYNEISGTDGMNGTLRSSLTSLIHPTSVPTYSGGDGNINYLSGALQYADEDPTNSNNMVYLYTRNSVAKNPATGWNREHVWPQSLSNGRWGKGRAGADMLHLRPTYETTNGVRSDLLYGDVEKTSGNKQTYSNMEYGYKDGTYFMPLDSVKGDVARICMYVWVAYYNEYGNNLPPLTNVFQSFDVLMSWHCSDKPDVMEGNRNNYAQSSMQGNRNPFVDHPEYAWKIFGSQCSTSVLNTAKATYPSSGGSSSASLSLNKTSATLSSGNTLSLTATASGGSGSITWTTSNSSIASLSASSGSSITVTAGNTAGNATVTASYSGQTANCEITVTSGGGGQTSEADYTISYTDLPTTYQTSTTERTAASGIKFIAYNCANYSSKMQFKASEGYIESTQSLNLNTVTINDRESNTLTVYGSNTSDSFSTTITGSNDVYNLSGYKYFKIARTSTGAAYCSSIDITVSGSGTSTPTVSDVTITPSTLTLDLNGTKTATLSATVNGTNNPSQAVTWSSDNEGVATVTAGGLVTGVAVGTATITATSQADGSKSKDCEVTVTNSASGGSNSGSYYVKISSSSNLKAGKYLIVYEGGNLAFDGSLTTLDATNNTIGVTIDNNKIAYSNTTAASEFTIEKSGNNYTIKSASNKYIGNSSNSNNLTASDSALSNTITINGGNADIVSSGGAYLRYNAGNDQARFRYYKSSSYTSQQAIQLYRFDGAASYATAFMDAFTCDSTGTNPPTFKTGKSWSTLQTTYNSLHTEDKNTLKNATANQNSTSIIEQAMARYDFVVIKYKYSNFINRTSANGSNRMSTINIGTTDWLIVFVSLSTFTGITLLGWHLKKRKER